MIPLGLKERICETSVHIFKWSANEEGVLDTDLQQNYLNCGNLVQFSNHWFLFWRNTSQDSVTFYFMFFVSQHSVRFNYLHP